MELLFLVTAFLSATFEARTFQQRLLSAAQTKFNAFNNGYYEYQYQHTCDCPICNIQPMNINVQNNTETTSQFAEGNDYAFTNFCFHDNTHFTQRISDSKLTIDDLFTLIKDSLAKEINIAVTYHDDIGIPLSISIPNANESDINAEFIAINCITFDATFPDPIAVDQTKATRGNRNNRNRDTETPSITDFNTDDPYSCSNILVPSQCSNTDDYFKCFRYSDGCNTCSCDLDGNVIGCTQRVCDTDATDTPQCLDCESNTEWVTCGGHSDCFPDCNSLDNTCGITASAECNTARCECPSATPRWNSAQSQCITESECGIGPTQDTHEGVCIPHCSQYTDGCLSCECGHNGDIITPCSLDENCSFEDKECIQCEDPDTMYYTQCGSPDVTCSNRDTFVAITQCIEKCQCKEEFPIYDPIQKKCITAEQCVAVQEERPDFGRCIEHCPVYFDGCNACQCPSIDGDSSGKSADFCSNVGGCVEAVGGTERRCFRCELLEMNYVTCGACDRTCNDPNPRCLQSDLCVEKCQCPLHAPIYDNGRCITFEQCDNVDTGGLAVESRQNSKVEDKNALQTGLIGESVATKSGYPWEDIVVFVVIVVICLVAGISLLFWPCLCMRNRIKNNMSMEDQLRTDGGPQLSYLPDGTKFAPVSMVSMVIPMSSGFSGNNSGHLP
eukprot:532314_1